MESRFYEFAKLFDADEYLYFMEDSLREENTGAQVDFVEQALGLRPPARVLDLGCGHGRHANELARRGHEVTGVDLVEGFLAIARQDAEREGLKASFVQGDIGSFEAEAPYDGAICLFDVLGFFDDAHQVSSLACAHRALVPGGRLLLDLRNRELMTRLPPAAVLDKGNGDLMIDRHRFDMETSRLVDRRTYVREGRQRDVVFSVRLWAFTEIRLVLGGVGFEVEAAHGGYDGAPLSPAKGRMLLLCRRA